MTLNTQLICCPTKYNCCYIKFLSFPILFYLIYSIYCCKNDFINFETCESILLWYLEIVNWK